VEGKLKFVFFPQPYRNLSQTKMWKIISYQNTFLKLAQLKCGRDLKYPIGVEETIFVQSYRNLPQTELWKMISYIVKTFLKFV
jgi:hypothetical protein